MKKVLITGGAGFIGFNAANHFLKNNWSVTIIDNFSRNTSQINKDLITEDIEIFNNDIRNQEIINTLIKKKFDLIVHLAAQVAVTSSIQNPRNDFEINALGTLNLLEAIRMYSQDTIFINASTNKVYGSCNDVSISENQDEYIYKDKNYLGISESHKYDFHTPYGCSKGIGDLYTLDYHRVYSLKTITLRQSCIYGPNQYGIEDQGWISWFIINLLRDKTINIYGNGKQVRDILHVNDLVALYEKIYQNIDLVKGNDYNIGGGIKNSISLIQCLNLLQTISKKNINLNFFKERQGDQKIYISDISKINNHLDWYPNFDYNTGIKSLYLWLKENL
jgi:CDP-paratose 2-epimerase